MEKFPVNSGNIPPPPSHSTNVPLKHGPLTNFQLNRAPIVPVNNGNRRRRKEPNDTPPMLKLERIIGLTSNSSNMIASDPTSDQIAYAAGAVIILYNYRKNKQVSFLYPPPSVTNAVATGTLQPTTSMMPTMPAWSTTVHPSAAEWASPSMLGNEMKYPVQDMDENNGKKRTSAGSRPKTISCLAFSADGNYLAAGEVGHQPRIFVWNVKQDSLVCVLKGHKFGIVSVAFSSDMRHLASVGFQHDGYLNVWNWRKGTKVASNRVTSRVHAMAFAKDGTHFITAGLRHIKFWNLSSAGKTPLQNNFPPGETQVLDGRSGLLGSLRNNNFVDAAYDPENPSTAYLLSETGLLCMFKEERVLDKWVDLQVKTAFSIDISNRYIVCACDNGIVRLFEPGTLRYCGMLPRPHPLGVDLSSFVTVQQLESIRDTAVYPDTLAIKFDATSNKVTCIYSDRSLIIWDVKHLQRIAMYRSFISHSECVWGSERFPQPSITDHAAYQPLTHATLPPYTFVTHSADGTVRFWNIDSGLPTSDLTMSPGSTSPTSPSASYPSFVSPPLSLIASASMKSTFPLPDEDSRISMRRNIFSKELVKMLYLDPEAAEFAKINKDTETTELPDHGIRALKISSDGSLLATGDRKGNLRVHRVNGWQEITYLEAHDSEILTIDFSTPASNDQPFLIASASRDRLIHVFDIQRDFKLLQTMDDHSSSITAVKFSANGTKLISCSADKSVIFRSSSTNALQQTPLYTTYHNHSGRATVFDMELDLHDKYLVMVTGERRLSLLSLETGKLFRTCKPETLEEDASGMTVENSGGSLIDVDLDSISGTFAVTAGSDKCVRLFDLMSGVCVYKVAAHSELVTSVRFLDGPNGILRIVSTSSDGSIFVWRVDPEITKKMVQRSKDRNDRLKQTKPETTTDAAPLRATTPSSPQALKQATPRLRRTSAVPPSQFSNQNVRTERKSFSHVSKSENKYDDLYKKLEKTPPPRIQTDTPQSPVLAARLKGRVSSPSPRDANSKGISSSVSTPRLITAEAGVQNTQWRGNFMPRKKESGGLGTSPILEGKADHGVSSLFPQRQPRNSPRLRHRISHDVLIQDRRGSNVSAEDSTNTSPQRPLQANSNRTIAHRRSNSSARLGGAETDELVAGSTSMPDLHAVAMGRSGKFANEMTTEPESSVDSDVEKDSLYDEASQNDASTNADVDDDPETVEDDIMVYLTPVVDTADPKPFQVEKAEQGNLDEVDGECNDRDDDDTQTLHSDTDLSSALSQTFTADDSDSSSEDNADEALVESIAMRNPPPMSTLRKASLKKSGRMSLRSIVKSFNTVKPASEPSPPPPPPPQSNHNRGESFSNFKRKMEQAKKRLSFSTRYLSNLNPQSPPIDDIKIEDGANIRSMSMPIAPQSFAKTTTLEGESRESASTPISIVLTAEELATINSVQTVTDLDIPSQNSFTADSDKQIHNDPIHIPTTAHAFDHASMLSEISAIGDRLDILLNMCEATDAKRSPIMQDDIGKQLKIKMEHVQKSASRILEEVFSIPSSENAATTDSAETTALLSEYSEKLLQIFERRLDSRQQSL